MKNIGLKVQVTPNHLKLQKKKHDPNVTTRQKPDDKNMGGGGAKKKIYEKKSLEKQLQMTATRTGLAHR